MIASLSLAMAPTSEDIHANLPDDALDTSVSLKDLDNSCETYFYWNGSPPPPRCAIPEASPIFRRALGTLDTDSLKCIDDTSESEAESDSDKHSSIKSISSEGYSSPSPISGLSPSSSPKLSKNTLSSPRPARSGSRKTSPRQYLSVPSSSLPTDLSAPCKADHIDSCAHTTMAGIALRKGCTRKSASFGGCDIVKPQSHKFEKKVSWADERGSKYQLIHVRLIRPRLATNTSDGTHSMPGHSILRATESCS